MIEFRNIKKNFGDKLVLNDVSHVMENGKANLIIGTSGSGKTVLQKCLVGLFEPDAGEIIYDGMSFTQMDEEHRKMLRQQIGMLFQGSALFDSMTVEENVRFPLDMFTKDKIHTKLQRVNEVLARVNLSGSNNKYPSEISGGMKKRVGIARAIVLNPKYLFCDEPNSGLDPKTSILIDGLIKDITKEYQMTTIVITHDMNSVIEIGDNVIFMFQGKKWWQGDRKSIITTDNPEIMGFVFASEFMKEIRSSMREKRS
jgi:phospholipid/cholesterol/gamma-HCH transport system ATP-binding protein